MRRTAMHKSYLQFFECCSAPAEFNGGERAMKETGVCSMATSASNAIMFDGIRRHAHLLRNKRRNAFAFRRLNHKPNSKHAPFR